MINTIVLMGRLTADPELKTTQSGISYVRFTVAVERPFKNGDEKITDFINCVAWRSTAEFISNYFSKGQMIAVVGSLQTGSYINAEGIKMYTADVSVQSVSFTGDKRSEPEAAPASESQRRTRTSRAAARTHTEITPDIDPDQDLPF